MRAAGRERLDHLIDQLGAAHAPELGEVPPARHRERDLTSDPGALADRREHGLRVVGVAEQVADRRDSSQRP